MKQRLVAIPVAVLVSALLALSACETSPEDGALLAQAREAVSQAASDPNVARYAPAEMDRAHKLLAHAEGSAKERGAHDEAATHYAYLAMQVARIAEQRANEQLAIARVTAAEIERQQILLTTGESDASRAPAGPRQLAAELRAAHTSRGMVLKLDDASFDKGKARLKDGAQRSIDQIAAFLSENPERRVQVEAFTDSEGTNEFNLELSQSRADAVAMAFIHRGIDADRVRALGYGEGFPLAGNTGSGSNQLSRRVEIVVSNDESAIPGRRNLTP
jgi:outer membrane protein OmpA-like peptidoglycan-associated protein